MDDMIKYIFKRLEAASVSHAVVRSFLEKFDGDIDIMISPKDLKTAEAIFFELGAVRIDKGRYWPHIQYHLMYQNEEKRYCMLILDVIIESWVRINQQAYHVFEDVDANLQKRVKDPELGLYFLDHGTRLRYLLLHTDLPLKGVSYRENEINRLIAKIKNESIIETEMVSGVNVTIKQVVEALEANNEKQIIALRSRLKKGIVSKNALFHAKVRIREKSARIYNRYLIRLKGFRRGLVISLVAPDGFGKTTITELVQQGLADLGLKNDSVYLGIKDGDLGQLKVIYKKVCKSLEKGKSKDEKTKNPNVIKIEQKATVQKQSTVRKILGLGAKAYHSLRIMLISFKLWRKSQREIIVTDRSLYNAFLPAPTHFERHSKDKRHELDDSLIRFLNKWIFSADLVFRLTGDAEIVSARKPEYDAETLKKTSEALGNTLHYAGIKENVIDTTSNPAEECVKAVLQEIFYHSRRKQA